MARAVVSGPEEDLSIEFNPAIEPGHTVNVVFRGFNPQSSIYQWSTELLADGEDPRPLSRAHFAFECLRAGSVPLALVP